MWDQFFTFLNTERQCHLPGGDAAAALSDRPTAFVADIISSHHRATM